MQIAVHARLHAAKAARDEARDAVAIGRGPRAEGCETLDVFAGERAPPGLRCSAQAAVEGPLDRPRRAPRARRRSMGSAENRESDVGEASAACISATRVARGRTNAQRVRSTTRRARRRRPRARWSATAWRPRVSVVGDERVHHRRRSRLRPAVSSTSIAASSRGVCAYPARVRNSPISRSGDAPFSSLRTTFRMHARPNTMLVLLCSVATGLGSAAVRSSGRRAASSASKGQRAALGGHGGAARDEREQAFERVALAERVDEPPGPRLARHVDGSRRRDEAASARSARRRRRGPT